MWFKLLLGLNLLVAATIVEGKPKQTAAAVTDYPDYSAQDSGEYDDEEYAGNEAEEKEFTKLPKFNIQGKTYTVDKGTTIKLPCYVDTFNENYVIMWKKVNAETGKESYMVVGDRLMTKDERMDVQLNYEGPDSDNTTLGSTLIIGLAADTDGGQYVCQLGTNEKKEIKHTVNVRAPPEIFKTPRNGFIQAKKGDTISMRCVASGDPVPTVSWTRSGKRLPDGSKSIKAEELVFKNANHKHTGTYICTANNTFGNPIRDTIEVDVQYAPEVEVEELFIHATAGNAIELVCNVKAHPTPVVKWFKNSMELTDETAKLRKHGHRHTLMIPSVSDADLGNYTCRAENKIGFAQRVLEVSGKAGFADFRSNAKGDDSNSYLLEWQSESRTRITSFALRYRENGQHSWQTQEVAPIPTSNFIFAGKHSFSDLKSATRYEATVAALNEDGWSRHSKVFHFATFGADDQMMDTVEDKNHNEPLRDVSSASSQFRSQHQSLLSATILAIFTLTWWHRL